MDVRKELEAIKDYNATMARKKEQLERAESLAERITAAIGGESVASSKNKTPMENAADRVMILKGEIAALEAENERRKLILSALVDSLSDDKRKTVIRGVYFDCKTKAAVGLEIDRTWRHIYNIIDAAIAELQRLADELNVA